MDFISSRFLWYGGLAVMVLAAAAMLVCTAVFIYTGRRLSEKLEQEYGKPQD